MSLRYGEVERVMWNQPPFRPLLPHAKLVYLALLTGPDGTTLPGLVECDHDRLRGQTKLTDELTVDAIGLLTAARMIEVDADHCLIRLIGVPRPAADEANPKVLVGWFNVWEQMPDGDLKTKHVEALKAACNFAGDGMVGAWMRTFGKVSPIDQRSDRQSADQSHQQSDRQSRQRSDQDPDPSGQRSASENRDPEETFAPDGAGQALKPDPQKPKREKPAKTPKAPRPPKPPAEPMPWTIAEMLDTLRDTCNGWILVDPFEPGLATPLTAVIRALHALGRTMSDVRLAGEYLAAVVPSWPGGALPLGWLAKTANLSQAITKAHDWDKRGRKIAVAGGGFREPSGIAHVPRTKHDIPFVKRDEPVLNAVKPTPEMMGGFGAKKPAVVVPPKAGVS